MADWLFRVKVLGMEKMVKRLGLNNRIRMDDKTREILFFVSLALIAMAAFLLVGADSYVLFDDSGSYLNMERYVEGVMPLYPLFLRMNRLLFGENIYLQAVVIEQSVFACLCLIIFTKMLRTRFDLNYLESYIIYLLSLLPFTTDMPDAMTTQEIVTEGIAYAAFYLFMAVLLKAVWEKSLRDVAFLLLITLFLAATRSQLQILFGVCGVIFFYIVLVGQKGSRRLNGIRKENAEKTWEAWNSRCRWPVRLVLGTAGCLIISLAGVWCTSRISVIYQQSLSRYTQRLQRLEAMEQGGDDTFASGEITDETIAEDTPQTSGDQDSENQTVEREQADGSDDPNVGRSQAAVTSQYTSLIFSRGMYEADYEDYQLFEDDQMRELYLYLYDVADQSKRRYVYSRPGLWMWKDIVGGIGSVGGECFYAQIEYYADKPEINQRSDYAAVRSANMMAIGVALVKAHWDRLLYHTLMLLPQAFICTVFFQIEQIYLLCHIVTLFLYLSAIGLMIWAYVDRKVDRAYAEFMSAVLGTNLVMVLVISLVFFGQQRYLVYNFGIFYMIYFLLLLQLWKIYGKNWLMKWIGRKES